MKRISFDTETHLIRPGLVAPPMVCLSWYDPQSFKSGLLLRDDAKDLVHGWLREAARRELLLVAHNAAFDMGVIMAAWPEFTDLVFAAYAADSVVCTRVRERLIDIARGELGGKGTGQEWKYGLADILPRRLKRKAKETGGEWRTRYKELDGVPLDQWPPEAAQYAIGDAVDADDLYVSQKSRAGRYKMPTQYLDSRAQFGLHLISCWGIRTDVARVERLSTEAEESRAALEHDLVTHGILGPKRKMDQKAMDEGRWDDVVLKKSMARIREVVAEAWPDDLGPVPHTDKGAVKTDGDTIKQCDDTPALNAKREYDKLTKLLSTYFSKLRTGFVSARYNELVASGRTSSFDPNTQNLPRSGVRECFVPREGHVFLATDFNSQELRCWAQVCLDLGLHSHLAEAYQKDHRFDPHQAFADAKGGTRQNAKIANFGIPGGMGAKGLVRYARGYGAKWSVEYAEEIKADWMHHWPEAKGFFGFIGNISRQPNPVLTYQRSGYERGGLTYCAAANSTFQGLASHASKEALFDVVRKCYCDRDSYMYGSRPVNFVHDEVILETPADAGHRAGQEMERVMQDAMQVWVPDIPSVAEATLMDRWSKADPVYSDGRLLVWREEGEYEKCKPCGVLHVKGDPLGCVPF